MHPRVAHDHRNRDKILSVRCPLTRSTVLFCARASDGDRVDSGPCDQRALIHSISSDAPCSATCPAKKRLTGNIVPHKGNEGNWHV